MIVIERLQHQSNIIVAAHRGFSSKYSENTLLAFQKAVESGAHMIELDLRLSKDGVVVIMHDETIDRTTNGSGKISDYTLSELKTFDAGDGETIPTLEEFCESLKYHSDILYNIEIKPQEKGKEAVDKVIKLLKEYRFIDRCVFTSFDSRLIEYIYEKYELKTQGFPEGTMANYISGEEGTFSKLWAIGLSMAQLHPSTVKKYKEAGKLVWCYCPDTEKQVNYALECGVTLMTCNNIIPALEIIEKEVN